MTVKIAVVGGGSSMFVPGLVRRLIEISCFDGAELRLMDVDVARPGVIEELVPERRIQLRRCDQGQQDLVTAFSTSPGGDLVG